MMFIGTLSQTPIFFALMVVLFFLSRTTIEEVFYFFSHFSKSKHVVYSLTSLVFFPGTVLHEMAHFIMAMILMLRVYEVKVFPEWEGNHIKLGKVVYEKKDFVRGIIVGIAPIFAGLFFFWFISYWSQLLDGSVLWKIAFVYAMFVISTTMFSSKQDLIDVALLIPLLIVGGVACYIFNIPVLTVLLQVLPKLDGGLVIINQFLFYSLVIHIILIVVFRGFRKYIKR